MSLSLSSIHPRPGNHELETRLLGVVAGCRRRKVVVIADECIYGRVSKVSDDAPVVVVDHERTIVQPGGAGNAATNVGALTGDIRWRDGGLEARHRECVQ